MNRQDYARRTAPRDLGVSALPGAPVVEATGTARPAIVWGTARHEVAARLHRTAAWLEPAPRPHAAI